MGAVRSFGRAIDPTTKRGLGNLLTGGLSGQAEVAIDATKKVGRNIDDWVSGKAQRDAARESAKGAEQQQLASAAVQRQWQEYLMGVQQPFIEASRTFLPQLTAFLDPEAQDAFRKQALESEGFQAVSDAASRGLIAQGAALGNRLSSGLQEEVLGQQGILAQQYGDAAVANRLSQLTAGAGLGLNALGQTAPQIGQAIGGIQNAYTNIGNIQSNLQAQLAQNSGITPWLNLATVGLGAYGATRGV